MRAQLARTLCVLCVDYIHLSMARTHTAMLLFSSFNRLTSCAFLFLNEQSMQLTFAALLHTWILALYIIDIFCAFALCVYLCSCVCAWLRAFPTVHHTINNRWIVCAVACGLLYATRGPDILLIEADDGYNIMHSWECPFGLATGRKLLVRGISLAVFQSIKIINIESYIGTRGDYRAAA